MRQNVEVLFAKLDPDASEPTQGSNSAAGWDLRALEDTIVEKGSSTKIRTGLAVAIPEGWEGQIRPRSGLALRQGLSMPNAPGTIDADYRGELKVLLINLGPDPIEISRGMRIAQIVFAPTLKAQFQVSKNLSQTARNTGGFGSTGTK